MSGTDESTSFDVICVGNAIVDALATVPDAALEEWGLTKGTMDLIDTERAEALYGARTDWVQASGGSGANTAAGVASLGGRVSYVGQVFDDELGQFFAADLSIAGVDYSVAPATDGPPTARCMILITPDAERTMNTFLGASAGIGPAQVPLDTVAASSICYGEGYLWDAEEAKAAISTAFEAATSAGRRTAFTLSDAFCVDRHRDSFLALLEAHVDVAFANESEVLSLFETEDFDEAATKLGALVEIAAITRGEAGSVVISGDDRYEVGAEPVEEVVDTTGAGDLYAAGFLYGLAHGEELSECARLGSIAAAEVISHVGPRPAVALSSLIG